MEGKLNGNKENLDNELLSNEREESESALSGTYHF